jgi:hypothetical protein
MQTELNFSASQSRGAPYEVLLEVLIHETLAWLREIAFQKS